MSGFGDRSYLFRGQFICYFVEFWFALLDDRSDDHTECIVISDLQINPPTKLSAHPNVRACYCTGSK